MTKTVQKISVGILVIAVVIGVFYGYRSYRKTHGVYVETLKVGNDSGWGYKIYVNGTMVINQYVMPAVSGNNPFPCENAARKTAELVVQKVSRHESPTVTVQEVENILKNNCQ